MTTSGRLGFGVLAFVTVASGCGAEEIDNPSTGEVPVAVGGALRTTTGLDPNTSFYVPPPRKETVEQVATLVRSRQLVDAVRIAEMSLTSQGVWFIDGTPKDVEKAVKKTVHAAALQRRVPVLVAYDIPFRDCAQYSMGGALDTAAYEAWIDGFAAGLGSAKAVVVLEPDGLGIIPYNTNLDGSSDWCKPTVVDAQGNTVPAPGADPASRYAQLNYAVDALAKKAPNAWVYLDGTHDAWLNVGEAASRLSKAGVSRARGFFLNVSNYQITADLAQYGSWISSCLAHATSVAPADFGSCPNQYWNGGPLPSKIAQLNGEWTGAALDASGAWSDTTDTAALNTSGINLRYANMLGTTVPTAHFIIDTSRNGRGPFSAVPYGAAPYDQPSAVVTGLNSGNWCNPPGAGLGLKPTANTGLPLADAYLWVKHPGESDGSCDISGGARAWDFSQYNPWQLSGAAQNHFDPLWGMVDPSAGAWFPEAALQLSQLASPPLR